KRPISVAKMEEVVDEIERSLRSRLERELASSEIGELVMKKLQGLDDVAYVRFASVYRQFKDITDFMKEVKGILK
ncbi:transcriptional repressor NrdR, partial [bacterium]|nr:transcriptional repressor NrdR [bacterium]